MATPLRLLAAIPLAILGGIAAMYGTAVAMRWMLGFEDDGTVSIHGAVGATGTVYLTIPGERQGSGKVMLTLQNRIVEYQAITSDALLPTGAAIMVVDVVGPDTVHVVADPTKKELSDAVR
jgi:ammonia channel protein AmtB